MSEDCPHCLYEKTHANCPGCWEGSHYRPKPMTNADRIRSSTDEELAKIMEYCGCCPPLACPHNEVGVYVTPQDCEMCWLEWFKSPAEDKDNG